MLTALITSTISIIEAIAAVMIAASVLGGVLDIGRAVARRDLTASITPTRLRLAERLVLSLEFLIAADILKTVTTPTLEGIGLLAGVILIRTVLSLSIAYELRKSYPARGEPESDRAGRRAPLQMEPNP